MPYNIHKHLFFPVTSNDSSSQSSISSAENLDTYPLNQLLTFSFTLVYSKILQNST